MKDTLFRQYISQQPPLWRELLEGRNALTADFARLYEGAAPDRLVLLGSGSSHYAALMARETLERAAGVEVQCLVPSEWRGESPSPAKRPLYIAVSQSGASTNTCRLIETLRGAGRQAAAVTERADSPVGRSASLTVALPMEPERIGAKTKGVSATVLTLMLLGLSVCRDRAFQTRMYAAMERLAECGAENLDRARAWSREHREALLPFRHLFVLGSGDGLGAAREGALKLLETNYLPASAYSLDEYLHGIQNALDQSACLLLLLPPEGPDRARMLDLADFARSAGARALIIAPGGREEGALCLADPGAAELRCLAYLPALQTLAAELSEARGIDVSRRRYPGFYARMGSKLGEV